MNAELIVAVFDGAGQAEKVLRLLRRMEHDHHLRILRSATMVEDQGGAVHVRRNDGVGADVAGSFETLSGALRSIVAPPQHNGFDAEPEHANNHSGHDLRDFVRPLRDAIAPGRSVLALIVPPEGIAQATEVVTSLKGRTFRYGPLNHTV